ncbi:MAG: DUF58 domain-containing protein [Chitinophagales bacterium]
MKRIRNFYSSLFFSRRFYILWVALIMVFILSYYLPAFFSIAQLGLILLLIVVILDYIVLFRKAEPITAERILPDRLSNGDQNKILLKIRNHYPFEIKTRIIDELPVQLQLRNFFISLTLKPDQELAYSYHVRPIERGEYLFQKINVYMKSPMGLVTRRKTIPAEKKIKVLPSFFEMKKYELMAYSNRLSESGNRKIRKLGHSLEFEQIKEYVTGDDIRSVNWKATGRRGGQLMINNYTDEKSQQVYCIIDKGRVMKMPFEGMTLLDYAINATLILSRVALINQDKAGLIIFAEQVGLFLPADQKALQMSAILENLYNQQTRFLETDFEKLHALILNRITQRSLIVLFTNFESLSALQRQLPYLRSIAKNHLLLVVFFENTELSQLTESDAKNIEELYIKTIAAKFAYEKKLIIKELQKHGIATILTAPQLLTVNAVNKYLEIKARRAI